MILSIKRHEWKTFFTLTSRSHLSCTSASNVRSSSVSQTRKTSRLDREYRRWLRKDRTRSVYSAVCKQIKQKSNSWFRLSNSIYQSSQTSQRWSSRSHMFVVCRYARRIARFDSLFVQRANNHWDCKRDDDYC